MDEEQVLECAECGSEIPGTLVYCDDCFAKLEETAEIMAQIDTPSALRDSRNRLARAYRTVRYNDRVSKELAEQLSKTHIADQATVAAFQVELRSLRRLVELKADQLKREQAKYLTALELCQRYQLDLDALRADRLELLQRLADMDTETVEVEHENKVEPPV